MREAFPGSRAVAEFDRHLCAVDGKSPPRHFAEDKQVPSMLFRAPLARARFDSV